MTKQKTHHTVIKQTAINIIFKSSINKLTFKPFFDFQIHFLHVTIFTTLSNNLISFIRIFFSGLILPSSKIYVRFSRVFFLYHSLCLHYSVQFTTLSCQPTSKTNFTRLNGILHYIVF